MDRPALDVRTGDDGSVTVRPPGFLGADDAVALRRVLVHTVRKLRPPMLVVDLADARILDAVAIGMLAAACALGDDHHVTVFLDNPSLEVAADLAAAGVPRHRLRVR